MFKKCILKTFLISLVVLGLLSATSFAEEIKDVRIIQAKEISAQEFIKDLGDTALMSLVGKGVTREDRENRIRLILNKYFDIDTIARFAMGTQWRSLSDNQAKEYLKLFEDMIVVTYTSRFEDYSGQKIEVGSSVDVGKKDSLVSSKIIQDGAPPINIDWRLRKKKDSLRIIDVVVEGISMSVTQRSDFSAVIQRSGGKVDSLLAMLRERNKEAAVSAKKASK